MNKALIAWLAGTAVAVISARGQGAFQNLDFEAAHNLPVSGISIATTNGLPGWNAYFGTNQLFTISYNDFTAPPKVGLYHPGFIGENYDVFLYDGSSISQTGLVPTNAQTLFFKAFKDPQPSLLPLSVFLGGQSLSYSVISNASTFTFFGVAIPSFAGQVAELAFFAPTHTAFRIDDVQFSSGTIPEPSTLGLFGLAGLFLGWRFLCKRT